MREGYILSVGLNFSCIKMFITDEILQNKLGRDQIYNIADVHIYDHVNRLCKRSFLLGSVKTIKHFT